MSAGRIRSTASATVIFALVWVCTVPLTPAAPAASWGGRVFQPDRSSPREGVVVSLVASDGEHRLASEPTRADGAFTITNARAGSYALEVQTPEGVFQAPQPVRLEAGANPPMALELRAAPFDAKRDHGLGDEGVSRRTEIIFAGVISLLALLVYLEIIKDETEQAASVN